MLTHERLVELYRDLRDESVLSVYLDVDEHDPAERDAWRRRLEREVGEARRRTEESGNGVDRFDQAWNQLKKELDEFEGFVPGRGWVGFATPSGVAYAEALPVAMPDLVRWEVGIRAAPYVRSLREHRPVVVVLADRQKARVLVARNGDVQEPEDLLADTWMGDLSDVGVPKRGARHTGVRGETSTDQAQRILEVSSERLWKRLGQAAADHAGRDGYIVLGGTPETVGRLAGYLPDGFDERVVERPSLHLEMSASQVGEAAREAADELTDRRHAKLVDQVIDQARSGGKGVLGRDATGKALREMRVDTLLVSSRFLSDDPDFADRCVGTGLAQQATVEEVEGQGGQRLDVEGGGIGARLRYRIETEAED